MSIVLISSSRHSLIFGLIIATGIGLSSWYLSEFIPRLGSVTLAILLGMLVGNLLLTPDTGIQGLEFAEKKLLPIAIVLLGVELQFLTLVSLGSVAALIIVISIATSIYVSIRIGALLGFSLHFSVLMGAGNGICGASAVAATSLAIDADESETGLSIGVVNLLGTVGIFLVPALIQFLTLTDLQGGLLIGGTLQAFGQAVAAGFSVNEDVGNIATIVKMGRVLMLGPMVVMLGVWIQTKQGGDRTHLAGVYFPRFILGFLVMSGVASLNLLPSAAVATVATSGDFLLVVAMAAIGMRIQFRTLLHSGVRSLLLGSCVSLIQTMVTALVIGLIA